MIKIKPYLNKANLKHLYFTFVYPYVINCVEVWSRAGQWVTNLGTVGNRYGFEFSILLIETA